MARLSRLAGGLGAFAIAAFATNGISPIPEPGTLFLVVGGLAALILVARHRKKQG